MFSLSCLFHIFLLNYIKISAPKKYCSCLHCPLIYFFSNVFDIIPACYREKVEQEVGENIFKEKGGGGGGDINV